MADTVLTSLLSASTIRHDVERALAMIPPSQPNVESLYYPDGPYGPAEMGRLYLAKHWDVMLPDPIELPAGGDGAVNLWFSVRFASVGFPLVGMINSRIRLYLDGALWADTAGLAPSMTSMEVIQGLPTSGSFQLHAPWWPPQGTLTARIIGDYEGDAGHPPVGDNRLMVISYRAVIGHRVG